MELFLLVADRREYIPKQRVKFVCLNGADHALGHRVARISLIQIRVVKDIEFAGIHLRGGNPAEQMAHHQHAYVGSGDLQTLHRGIIREIRIVYALTRHAGKQAVHAHRRRAERALRQRKHQLARQVRHDLHGTVCINQRVAAEQRHAVGIQRQMDARRAEIIVKRHVQLGLIQQ